MSAARAFYLQRFEDASGVSGVGLVAVGAQLPSGRCVLEWLVSPGGLCVYGAIEDVVQVHGHAGKTGVFWSDTGEDVRL